MTLFSRGARNDAEFEDFVRAQRGGLSSAAYLLCAGDHHLAEDLVQTALVKTYLAWGRVRGGHPGAFARRVLFNAFIDHKRKPAAVREQLTAELPELGGAADEQLLDPALVAALAGLPARQRAAVVLRHVDDMSVEEVAAVLGCTAGTVKSQTARGLAAMRDVLGEDWQESHKKGKLGNVR